MADTKDKQAKNLEEYMELYHSSKIQSILDLYRREDVSLQDTVRTAEDESSCRRAFVQTYKEELDQLFSKVTANDSNYFDRDGMDVFTDTLRRTPSMTSLLSEYKSMKRDEKALADQKTTGRAASLEVKDDPMKDTTVDPKAVEGVKNFQKWLYRNCDKGGVGILGGEGSVRRFAEEFSKKPLRVQLKTLYLIETNQRKHPSPEDTKNSQNGYIPNLDHLKDRMIATKFKFWKRLSGSQFYWHKLSESLKIAEADQTELAAYSAEQESAFSKITSETSEIVQGSLENVNKVKEHSEFIQNIAGNVKKVVEDGTMDMESNILEDLVSPDSLVGKGLSHTGSGLHILNTLSGLGTAIGNISNLAQNVGKLKGIEVASTVSEISSTAMSTGQSVTDTVAAFKDTLGIAADTLETIGTVGSSLGLAASVFELGNSGLKMLNEHDNRNQIEKAEKYFGDMHIMSKEDQTMTKKVVNFTKQNADRALHAAQRSFAKAVASTVASTVTLTAPLLTTGPVGATVVAGAAITATAAALALQAKESLYNSYHDRQNRYADTLNVSLDMDQELVKARERLTEKQSHMTVGSPQYKRIQNLLENEEHLKKTVYDLRSAQNGSAHRGAYSEAVSEKIGDFMYKKAFYDEKNQLVTEAEEKQHLTAPKSLEEAEHAKMRMGFRELIKGSGLDVTLPKTRSEAPSVTGKDIAEKLRR